MFMVQMVGYFQMMGKELINGIFLEKIMFQEENEKEGMSRSYDVKCE